MIVYHGSCLIAERPDIYHSRDAVAFGKGFYVTPLYEQAKKWAEKFERRGKMGFISRYQLDEAIYEQMKTICFTSYSEEWLEFILKD